MSDNYEKFSWKLLIDTLPPPLSKKTTNMEFENRSCPGHPNASQVLVWYVFEGPTTKPQEVFGCLASQIPGLQPENSTSRASHVLKGELVWWVDIRIYSMFSGS